MQTYDFSEVYDAMLGESSPIDGINDAFAEGSFCAEQYEIMWKAYTRLLDRLNQPGEDPDIEIIRGTLSSIQRELCRRMYQYGAQFGK